MLTCQNKIIKLLIILIFLFVCCTANAQNPYKDLYDMYKEYLININSTDPEFKIVRIVKCYELIELKSDSIKVTTELTVEDFIADSKKLLHTINKETPLVIINNYAIESLDSINKGNDN